MLLFIIGAVVLSFFGLDFLSSIGASAASLGNVGPSLGDFGPVSTYASMPNGGKIWCSFLMLVGRLELFTALILFTPLFLERSSGQCLLNSLNRFFDVIQRSCIGYSNIIRTAKGLASHSSNMGLF